jgi:hypothetical protein
MGSSSTTPLALLGMACGEPVRKHPELCGVFVIDSVVLLACTGSKRS